MAKQSNIASIAPRSYTTGQLCKVAGVTRGQLRIYEREGLIEAPQRTESGYRCYDALAPARLRAILLLKEIGFTLAEIAPLLSERDLESFTPQRLQAMSAEQLTKIDARMARLRVVRSFLAPLSVGDMSVLSDPDCSFLVKFLSAAAPANRVRRVSGQSDG